QEEAERFAEQADDEEIEDESQTASRSSRLLSRLKHKVKAVIAPAEHEEDVEDIEQTDNAYASNLSPTANDYRVDDESRYSIDTDFPPSYVNMMRSVAATEELYTEPHPQHIVSHIPVTEPHTPNA